MSDTTCPTCAAWGDTITREQHRHAIPCPACGRLTWPNTGVNLPAGAAIAFGAGNAMKYLRLVQEAAAHRRALAFPLDDAAMERLCRTNPPPQEWHDTEEECPF